MTVQAKPTNCDQRTSPGVSEIHTHRPSSPVTVENLVSPRGMADVFGPVVEYESSLHDRPSMKPLQCEEPSSNFELRGTFSDRTSVCSKSEILNIACPLTATDADKSTLNGSITSNSSANYCFTTFNDVPCLSHGNVVPSRFLSFQNLQFNHSLDDSSLQRLNSTTDSIFHEHPDGLNNHLRTFGADDPLMSAWIEQWANPTVNERGFMTANFNIPFPFSYGLSLESTHVGSKDSSSVSDPECCTTTSSRMASCTPHAELTFPFSVNGCRGNNLRSSTPRDHCSTNQFTSRNTFLKASSFDATIIRDQVNKEEGGNVAQSPTEKSGNRLPGTRVSREVSFPFFDAKHMPASKRWQNLNVVLPLYLPQGTVLVTKSTGENTYVFPDTYPAAQLLFSSAGRVCDIWASVLRLRVAVVHKCPEFLVPRLVEMFNSTLSCMSGIFSEPLTFRCVGLLRHSIHMRSAGSSSYRYDTVAQLPEPSEHAKLLTIFSHLQRLQKHVNTTLRQEAEAIFGAMEMTGFSAPVSDVYDPETRRCSLEFRFSPCREFKVAVREGTPCECGGLDGVLSGGGVASISTWSQQISVENVLAAELRLERDKSQELEADPMFGPAHNVMSRTMSKDHMRNPGRVVFCDTSTAGAIPRVETSHGISVFAAAQTLCGATHETLASWLPRGMRSLTDHLNRNEDDGAAAGRVLPTQQVQGWQLEPPSRHALQANSAADNRLPLGVLDDFSGLTFKPTPFFDGANLMDSNDPWSGRSGDGRGWTVAPAATPKYPNQSDVSLDFRNSGSNDDWPAVRSPFWNSVNERCAGDMYCGQEFFSLADWNETKCAGKSVVLDNKVFAPPFAPLE